MDTTARSVMTDQVVTVSPEASLLDVLRLFVEEGIHGAPVVGQDGEVEGVISTSDLLRAQEDEHESIATRVDYFREFLEFSAPDFGNDLTDFQDRLGQRRVAEVMTRQFLSVDPETSIAEIARCLREHQIHRVWVVEKGHLCGVVSTLDLMPVIESLARQP